MLNPKKLKIKGKILKYRFLRNKGEIITGIITAILFVIAAIYTKEPRILLLLSLPLVFFSTLITIYFRSSSKDFFYNSMTKERDKNDWLGKGKFEYDAVNNCFMIEGRSDAADYDSTYIYKNCFIWSDYRFTFNFKIVNSCIGAVVRAIDLSNLIMLQIHSRGINPHIKINRRWVRYNYDTVGLVNENDISPNIWYKAKITCRGDVVNIKISDNENLILNNSWNIPFTVRVGRPSPVNKNVEIIESYAVDLNYGSVGFRNSRIEQEVPNRDEKALVKDILIEKI